MTTQLEDEEVRKAFVFELEEDVEVQIDQLTEGIWKGSRDLTEERIELE